MRRLAITLIVLLVSACAPSPPATSVPVGAPVIDAGLTVTVTGTEFLSPLSDYYQWGRWLVVYTDVAAEEKTTWFNAMNQQLFIDEREFWPDPLAADSIGDDTASGASLLPGERAAIALAFNVSKAEYTDTSRIDLVIRGDADSAGVTVPLPPAVLAGPPKPGRSSPQASRRRAATPGRAGRGPCRRRRRTARRG